MDFSNLLENKTKFAWDSKKRPKYYGRRENESECYVWAMPLPIYQVPTKPMHMHKLTWT